MQADLFKDQGCVRLEGFYPRKRLEPTRNAVLDALEKLKLWRASKRASHPLLAHPPFQQIAKLSTLVKVPGLQEALMTPELLDVVARLSGHASVTGADPQLLLSLPHRGAWTLEGLNWHVDVTAKPPERLPGIQVFVLIDDVAPRGGATLALAGSHRVVAERPGFAPSLREVLKTSTNLEASLEAIGISVVEMSGRAGDVYLMDMRLLHTPSINATKNVRMMATSRFFF